jgi:Cell division protein CrgA
MAPPKRKTGGRTTPSGTKPGDRSAPKAAARTAGAGAVGASARYTPPIPASAKESPPWVPVLMLVLFALGALAIMLRYLVFDSSNWPMVVGLVCLLGGLFTATKWR